MKRYDFCKQYTLAELIEIGCYKCKHDLQFHYDSDHGDRALRIFRCLTCGFAISALPKFQQLPIQRFLGYQIYYMTGSGMWLQCIRNQVRVMYNHRVACAIDQAHIAHKQMKNIGKLLML